MDHRIVSGQVVTTALAVLLAGGLAACGAAADNSGSGSNTGPGRSPAPGASAAPSGPGGSSAPPSGPIRTLPSAKAPTKPTGELTLIGTVQEGVEPGCLLMKTGGSSYQLMDGDPKVVRAGARLVITGHLVTGIMSYCMQGQPFHVSSAHAA